MFIFSLLTDDANEIGVEGIGSRILIVLCQTFPLTLNIIPTISFLPLSVGSLTSA